MKSCVSTLTDDNFIIGTKVLIKSFLVNNQWFNDDIVILYDELEEKNILELKNIYDNIVLKKIQIEDYSKNKNCNKHHLKTYYKFEAFNLKDYDFTLFLDSDTLIIRDIKYLYNLNDSFWVGLDFDNHCNAKDKIHFNSGVMAISQKWSKDIKHQLIDNIDDSWHDHGEQTILNKVIKNYNIFDSMKYNCLKTWFRHYGSWVNKVCIIHYIAKKPWQNYNPNIHYAGDLECYLIEQKWINFHNKYFN